MADTELLPCPFCGGNAYITEGMFPGGDKEYIVECEKCDVLIPHGWTEEDVVIQWNCRLAYIPSPSKMRHETALFMLYITKYRAFWDGFTHEGKYFGVPAWFVGEGDGMLRVRVKYPITGIWCFFMAKLMPPFMAISHYKEIAR